MFINRRKFLCGVAIAPVATALASTDKESTSKPFTPGDDMRVNVEDFGCSPSKTPQENANCLNSAIDSCISNGIKNLYVNSDFVVDDVTVPVRNKTRIFLHGNDIQGLYRRASLKGNEPSNCRIGGNIPDISLKQFSDAVSPVVVMMGDSLSGYSVSDCTPPDSMYGCIVQHIKEKNPDTQISFYNRGIGGQVWGNANNLPGAFPAWYVDRQKPWLDYVKDLSPDLLFLAFGMNDAQGFDAPSMHAVIAKIKSWSKVPSIVFVTTPNPSMSTLYGNGSGFYDYASQEGRDYVAGYVRSYAKRNGYGLLDINRQTNLLRDGRDILSCPMTVQEVKSGSYAAPSDACHEYYFNGSASSWGDNRPVRFIVGAGSQDWVTINKNGNQINIVAQTNAGVYENINYTMPVSSIGSISLSVTSINIVISLDGESEIARFNCIRHGGEFHPRISYPNTDDGPFSSYYLSMGYPERVQQSLFDDDIFGTPGIDAKSKKPWGGNGVNHYSSQGVAAIVRPVVESANIQRRSYTIKYYDLLPTVPNIIVVDPISAVLRSGVVTLQGSFGVGGSSPSTKITTLPAWCRPKKQVMVSGMKMIGAAWSPAIILIGADGSVTFYETAPADRVQINVTYSVL